MGAERSPDPRRFNPDRFADDETTLYQSVTGDSKKRDTFTFGAVRRLCPGIHITERSFFLGISRLPWGFNVSKVLDNQRQSIPPPIDDLVGGVIAQPRDYPAKFTPMSPGRIKVVRNAVKEFDARLDPETEQWSKVLEGMAFSTWTPEKTEG
ncbi:uncharacterized protein Z520_03662 [Fonsecaea multimorphosa CBS 102226]|uniref:Uncharacterized protein n=1 Tax=Fonsecaea multimorphosa CBS 102226 TaxID=1442371 RepID=A0A0D2HGI0_9EURO|nr:uncharacterized protein Z520_03662 [Fonsecaea multimorphosa CBS 102226]KIY00996.1 hypothetical protein Z520_03662 [Fonsecaea multimorphosa CBS 102226]OAL27580.1 hypothetical protein AYO22_03484 [Fonsecaea multimorphosa]